MNLNYRIVEFMIVKTSGSTTWNSMFHGAIPCLFRLSFGTQIARNSLTSIFRFQFFWFISNKYYKLRAWKTTPFIVCDQLYGPSRHLELGKWMVHPINPGYQNNPCNNAPWLHMIYNLPHGATLPCVKARCFQTNTKQRQPMNNEKAKNAKWGGEKLRIRKP